MKIIKYEKKGGNKYQLTLSDNSKILLYEDIILKEELLLKKEIDDVDLLLQKNKKYSIYEISLKYLNIKVRSIKEMYDYLVKKEYDIEDIEDNINKLIKNGYLNDEYYAKCYINDHINLSNDGPNKIINYLESNNISYNIYSKYMNIKDSVWIARINKYIEKNKRINKKSYYAFKNKMLINLINLGYDREMIESCLSHVYIDNLDDLRKKEEEKLRLRLSRKYSGDELERKIKEKLYQKGFFN